MTAAHVSLPEPGAFQPGADLAMLRHSERSMRKVRWVVAGLTLLQFALYQPPAGLELPFPRWPVGLTVALTAVAVNLVSILASRVDDAAYLRGIGRIQLAADATLVLAVVWLFSFDPTSALWALCVLPVLEGALRDAFRGAVWTWAYCIVLYVLRDVWAAHTYAHVDLELASLTYRGGVVFVVALTAGYLAAHLAERIASEQEARFQLAHRAAHDNLTGLVNRGEFFDRLDVLAATPSDGRLIAVLFVDLDNFKTLNDEQGHHAGDRILSEVGERLVACVRPGDTVARFGGDEFTVLLDELASPEQAELVAERIVQRLRDGFTVEDTPLVATGSIGVAIGRRGVADPRDLLRQADAAMYEAKAGGAGRWALAPFAEGPGTPPAATATPTA